MKADNITDVLEIPEGVQVQYQDGVLTAKGPKGEVKRKIYSPKVKIAVEGGNLTMKSDKPTKKEKAMIGTFRAHIRNIFKGVDKGYTYKLKICAGHFPMNVAVSGNQFTVKNFLGEKVPRVITLKEGAAVKIEGEFVVVEALNKEIAGQTAADIEQLTVVKNRDRRIFQDGIFIVEKDEKKIG